MVKYIIRIFCIAIFVFLTLCLIACTKLVDNTEYPTEDSGEWLFMVYLDGANNLEEFAINDFNEMELGLSKLDTAIRDNIKIIVLFDRISGYDNSNENWTGTRVFEVLPDTDPETINSIHLKGWWGSGYGELNVGDPQTLSKFINYCKTYYTYTNHALILWDHGDGVKSPNNLGGTNGSRAICYDDDNNDDPLYLDEVQQAITAEYNSNSKLQILGFDACYMGMVEIAYEFRDIVDYMVASPNLESVGGWDYEAFISSVTSEMTSDNLAQTIVETFRDSLQGLGDKKQTLTSVDISKIKILRQKIDELATELGNEEQTLVEQTRENTSHYFDTSYDSITWPNFDIGHFCELIIADSNFSSNTQTVATETLTAFNNTIHYAWGDVDLIGGEYEGQNTDRGLSIFFSRGNIDYNGDSHYSYNGWWYSSVNISEEYGSEYVYGRIDFCDGFNDDGIPQTWKELLESYYDLDNTLSPSDTY